MRDYGKVYGTFWTSETTRGLTDQGRLLALYLLTGPHSNMIGCFRLPDGYVEEDLGWASGTVAKRFAELFRNGFATRDEVTKWVFLPTFLKWNQLENPNQGKAAARLFEQIPKSISFKCELARQLATQGGKVPIAILEPFLNGSETVTQTVSEPGTGTGTGTGTGEVGAATPTTRRFVPPTVEQVAAYVATRDKKIDPQKFVDYYAAKGWKVGKSPMKDWQAAVRTWEANESGQQNGQPRKAYRNPRDAEFEAVLERFGKDRPQ